MNEHIKEGKRTTFQCDQEAIKLEDLAKTSGPDQEAAIVVQESLEFKRQLEGNHPKSRLPYDFPPLI